MLTFLSTIQSVSGISAACLTGGAVTMLADSVVSDKTPIELGLVGGLIVAVFYAGTTLQKLKDGQKATNARLSRIERKLEIEEYNEDTE